MQTVTAGHLSSNGGVRGHSAGDFFPYRVMVQGTIDSLTYWVIDPTGAQLATGYDTAKQACGMALIFKEYDDIGF